MGHPFVTFFGRHPAAERAFVGFAVLTGSGVLYLDWYNASRASLGVASLDDAHVADLGRRQVLCSHPTWHCEAAVHDDTNGFVVPFECGKTETLYAGFPSAQTVCDRHRASVGGFFMDLNEAGGGPSRWIVRVDAPASSFPDLLTLMGLGVIALGIAFPRLLRAVDR